MSTDTGFDIDEMREIIEDFLVEADELVQFLDSAFVQLEAAPSDLDLLNEIFRAVHTIKGTSSFLGFEQVTNLSHKMEDILNKLRKSELTATAEIMDVLLQGLDLLKLLLKNVRNDVKEPVDIDEIIQRLSSVEEGSTDVTAAVKPPAEDPEPEISAVLPAVPLPDAETTPRELPQKPNDPTPDAQSSLRKPAMPAKKPAEQTIRVGVDRLDTLMNMMGELVLGRNALLQGVGALNAGREGEHDHELEAINAAAKGVNFITTELQMAVMAMRMLPIGKIFSRFPRQVRDLSRDSGKKIELVVSGEGTELDKSVIEEIGDPLMHIIRNSCDHGLELPEERVALGKPDQGTIWLDATQEGSNIVISIRDDGRGLDIDAIRAKALERGVASSEEIERMSKGEIFRFIFHAGFSTAKKVTEVSGRGVGMDVVRTNIEKLNGIIELDSEVNVGTTVTIKLPLTLAIVQGLLVECDEEIFILPLSSVQETVKLDQTRLFSVNQRSVFRLRDEVIPLVNIADVLAGRHRETDLERKPYVVVVGLAEKKLGILIDRFLGQEEVVIKGLGEYLGAAQGVAGATILGDGRIRLIVDMIGLFNLARKYYH
ncbi:MAG: chemotaxis protein CheA [bacterium]